jgi:hypothetical protein
MTRAIVALFDTATEAEQASQHLAMNVSGVRGEVFGSGRANELASLTFVGEDVAAFSEGIRRGGTVLYAEVPDTKFEKVASFLERDGAVDIDEREKSWRLEGWTTVTTTGGTIGTTATRRTDMVSGSSETPGTTGASIVDFGTSMDGSPAGNTGMATTARDGVVVNSIQSIPIVEKRLRTGKQETGYGSAHVRSYVVETARQE